MPYASSAAEAPAEATARTRASLPQDNGGDLFEPAPTSPEDADFPADVAVGDFNGDGDLDLAVANGGSVMILLGDGTGDFTEAPTSPEGLGAQPSAIAVGDFDGDGDLDLAATKLESNDVTILLGDGTGDFTEAPTNPEGVGDTPYDVSVGDFNSDGDLDLAVANTFSDNVTILLGDGTGDFTEAPTSPEGVAAGAGHIAVGDFDGDGDSDLAVVGDFGLSILLGDGTGDFTEVPASPVDAPGFGVATGDFNGDGDLDLAVAGTNVGYGTILLGDGTGDFTEAPTSPERPGFSPSDIAVGDFDGDGDLDLAVPDEGSDEVTILLGDGTGDFTEAPGSPEPVGDSPVAIAVGDFDGDGDLDLTVTNRFSDNVTILINQSPDAESPSPLDDESPSASEKRASTRVAALAAELPGARPSAALGRAVLRRKESAPRVGTTADRARAADPGAEAIPLARTGLLLPPLALVASLLLGAGARLRRSVGGRMG